MAYVTLLTSTDCAFRPVPFRNYDLMPSKRWEGSFWVHRAGLGAAISVWVGSYIMLTLWWRRCVSLLTNPGTPYSGTNSVNETHLNTMTSQFRPAFLKLHSEKPWSSVRYVRVSPEGIFDGSRTVPLCFHRHLGDFVVTEGKNFPGSPTWHYTIGRQCISRII